MTQNTQNTIRVFACLCMYSTYIDENNRLTVRAGAWSREPNKESHLRVERVEIVEIIEATTWM